MRVVGRASLVSAADFACARASRRLGRRKRREQFKRGDLPRGCVESGGRAGGGEDIGVVRAA